MAWNSDDGAYYVRLVPCAYDRHSPRAFVTSEEHRTINQAAGPPTDDGEWVWDDTSGYYHNLVSGMYYDGRCVHIHDRYNIASFHGSSCANNGKGALNTLGIHDCYI
eukprot:2952879-Pyramimonas_sp.AAC.2